MSLAQRPIHKIFKKQSITRTLLCVGKAKEPYGTIGDKTNLLMQLPNNEFMSEIMETRAQFRYKFPELVDVIHEYKKQRILLDLDFWYEKPVPEKCQRFFEIEVFSLMENIEQDGEEAETILQLCHNLLCEYLPNKYGKQI
jgi:hypothetical protein